MGAGGSESGLRQDRAVALVGPEGRAGPENRAGGTDWRAAPFRRAGSKTFADRRPGPQAGAAQWCRAGGPVPEDRAGAGPEGRTTKNVYYEKD